MSFARSLFLPVSRDDMVRRGWDSYDILLITGDAYVDHPSFGPTIIGRVLEAEGYRVAILAQPDWRTPESFTALGRPTGPSKAGGDDLRGQPGLHGGPLHRRQKAPP